MISTPPVSTTNAHGYAGSGNDRPPPDGSPASLRERIAALEITNHALRLEAQGSAEHARFQLAEAQHRLMNTFSTIHTLAMQTARPGDTGDAFRADFEARLMALARSHDLLGPASPDGVPLNEVVGRCLRPYEDAPDRITLSGPAVHLPGQDVPTLGLALHELTTNAAKHGALSVPEGRVEVAWGLETGPDGQARWVAISWQERNGPPVATPKRRGFGSRLLERGLAHGSGGTAELDFAPHGVACRIRMPLTSAHGTT